ncbi:MAG: Ldh family oxidoreductase [Dehalococcoidia bacterium]|nr:MAG: Ldh family oxidoreductase [Dehalococcoidia bacterium]
MAGEPTPDQIASGEFVRVDGAALREQMARLFVALRVSEEHAAIASDILVASDLRGVDTHGVVAGLRYLDQIESGLIDATVTPRLVRESAGSAVVSNAGGLGVVGAHLAMRTAIEKARVNGIGHAGVVEGRHIGMVGYYPMMAAAQDMIGMAVTNANRSVRPARGADPRFGTNPIAFAAPAGTERPFVLDMATSTVAAGKVRRAHALGLPIPRGWAVDAAGRPLETPPGGRDTSWALTPLGESSDGEGVNYKGYGLAMMVDILAGVLAGGGSSADLDYGSNMSWFMAIDISQMRPVQAFKADMDLLIRYLAETRPSDPARPVVVAGDPEADAFEYRSRAGIPLHRDTLATFRLRARTLGTPSLV